MTLGPFPAEGVRSASATLNESGIPEKGLAPIPAYRFCPVQFAIKETFDYTWTAKLPKGLAGP